MKVPPFNLDIAYVRNMARSRVDELFGTESNSILAPFTIDYGALAVVPETEVVQARVRDARVPPARFSGKLQLRVVV